MEAAPPPSPALSKPWPETARVLLLLFGALFLLFPKVWLGLETFYYRDYGVLGVPTAVYAQHSFWRGELPFWNPYSNCGAPFLAQWGTMCLYPGSLFFLLLPLPWSLNIFCLLHFILGGLGMHHLVRRLTGASEPALLAAVAFVFNGISLAALNWPNYTAALGWMPWVVGAARQVILNARQPKNGISPIPHPNPLPKGEGREKEAVKGGEARERESGFQGSSQIGLMAVACGACQMLTGVPEIILFTWGIILTLAIFETLPDWRWLWTASRNLAGIILLVALISAIQLWPFLDLLMHSQREASFDTGKWALPGWAWANFLVPLFHCFQTPQGTFFQESQHFLSSTYLGGALLLFMGLGFIWGRSRTVWALFIPGVLSIILALGDNGYLYGALRSVLPEIGFARYPIKFLYLTAFVAPVLAAIGWQRVLRDETPARSTRLAILAGATALFLLAALILLLGRLHPFPFDQWQVTFQNALGRLVLLAAFVTVIAWPALVGLRPAHRVYLLAAVLIIDGAIHMPKHNPRIPSATLQGALWEQATRLPAPRLGEGRVMITPEAEKALLRSHVPDGAQDMLGKRVALWSHLNLLEPIAKVNGSSTLQIREQAALQKRLYASTNAVYPAVEQFLSVQYKSAPGSAVNWAAQSNYLSWATLGARPVYAPSHTLLEALLKPDFNSAETVLLPDEAPRLDVIQSTNRGRIVAQKFKANRMDFQVDAPAASWLVLNQSYYFRWRAYADGQAVPIHQANFAFMGVLIPAGVKTVSFVYEDTAFRYGALLSALTVTFLLIHGARKFGVRLTPHKQKHSD